MSKKCPDCGVEEGMIHLDGCDWEKCPKCGKQVLMYGFCKGVTEREPFFDDAGFFCERCGEHMPETKMVSNEEWSFICGETYPLNCILCPECMDFISKKRREKDE